MRWGEPSGPNLIKHEVYRTRYDPFRPREISKQTSLPEYNITIKTPWPKSNRIGRTKEVEIRVASSNQRKSGSRALPDIIMLKNKR